MALNDIKVPKENAQGTFDETVLVASDLKLGTTSGLPIKTGAGGLLVAGAFGSSAGEFCEGNDSRLTPSYLDTAFEVKDNADTTRKMMFQCSGISAGTTRTLTIPNASGTIKLSEEVRSDFVTDTAYIGLAPLGSAESANVWTIYRIIIDSEGNITSTTTATNVAWDDRLTATYT